MAWAERSLSMAEVQALIERRLRAFHNGQMPEPVEPETAWTATGGRLRLILRELEAASLALPSNVDDTPLLRGWLDAARILIEACEQNAAINDAAEREKIYVQRGPMFEIDVAAMEAAMRREASQLKPNVMER